MKKITLIAGIATNFQIYGGEVIKNKTLLNFLKSKFKPTRLVIIDTFNWQRDFLRIAFRILFVLLNPKRKVIILSCFTTGAYFFLRVYRITSKISKKDIYYFIVGGSLPDYVEKNKVKLFYYQNIPMFAESINIRDRLIAQGMSNISVIPNWKFYNYLPELAKKEVAKCNRIKALSYSRICPEKGTDIIFSAVDKINRDSIKIEVDFYGDIQDDYEEIFNTKIASKSYFVYKGKMDMTIEENYSILSRFDIMLFPTYYFGEGVPGAILDCFIAGVPVLASDWNFNKELVEHLKTGLLYEAKSVAAFYDSLVYIIENKNIISEMKKNCVEKAKLFKIDFLLNDFIRDII